MRTNQHADELDQPALHSHNIVSKTENTIQTRQNTGQRQPRELSLMIAPYTLDSFEMKALEVL